MIVGLLLGAGYQLLPLLEQNVVTLHHAPDSQIQLDADLTLNITGTIAGPQRDLHYRINGSAWQPIPHDKLRASFPNFTLEIASSQLMIGENCIGFDVPVTYQSMQLEGRQRCFDYQPRAMQLPFTVDWADETLNVQDGHWEVVRDQHGATVRPVPGSEDYDRILLVSGAFAGPRRVETQLVFRQATNGKKPFGFGVLPLWGGHPDQPGHYPRRGWRFGLGWYYSRYPGIGVELSEQLVDSPARFAKQLQNFTITPNQPYNLIIEAEWQRDQQPAVVELRMKWWPEGESEPVHWISVQERAEDVLPSHDYAVALLAHRTQVEFGSVRVMPIVSAHGGE
ncbi:hypothetical protein BOW53_05235 [Solemya pervernicosa gill symbiont]|uniref:Uncharacterized protein n=1 Tax=Solemya pervernicosa gill symbiont TaxID=642797 RepID=A0A1T2L7V9_9GAMM|nr:hypothetical protein BOW53_05235 [Solemya pervernicosa gill symbiont]